MITGGRGERIIGCAFVTNESREGMARGCDTRGAAAIKLESFVSAALRCATLRRAVTGPTMA